MIDHFLHERLAQAQCAGIFRLPSAANKKVVEHVAKTLGFAFFETRLNGLSEAPVALAAMGRDLNFPAWYGCNFDALNDCLSDLSWQQAPGYVTVITGADSMRHKNSDGFQTLNEVLASAIEDWRARNVPFWVFYDLPDTTDTWPPILT